MNPNEQAAMDMKFNMAIDAIEKQTQWSNNLFMIFIGLLLYVFYHLNKQKEEEERRLKMIVEAVNERMQERMAMQEQRTLMAINFMQERMQKRMELQERQFLEESRRRNDSDCFEFGLRIRVPASAVGAIGSAILNPLSPGIPALLAARR